MKISELESKCEILIRELEDSSMNCEFLQREINEQRQNYEEVKLILINQF